MSRSDGYAREVLRAGRDLGITPRGIVIGFATVCVECDWIMYANAKVPESLDLPHERVGSDGFSVGLFQQQIRKGANGQWWWSDCATCMDPYKSARLFFDRLALRNYNHGDAGAHAQAVQGSAFPDRYGQRMAEAQQLYDRIANEEAPVGWKGDPVWLADVLRAEGLQCDIFPGAMDRGHGDMGDIWGIVAHHTGASGSPGPGAIANHPQLGLCSQLHLDRGGKYTLCGVGVAWHAGNGSWPGLPANGANNRTIGIEAENNGTEGWSIAQYGAYVRGCAAIIRKLGYKSDRVIGHKEWAGPSQGKWDPGGIDMNDFRRDVQAVIDGSGEELDMSAVEHIENFIKGYVGPVISDVKDIRQQLTGGRDAGEYPGWEQLGGKTVVDAIADIQKRLAALETKETE